MAARPRRRRRTARHGTGTSATARRPGPSTGTRSTRPWRRCSASTSRRTNASSSLAAATPVSRSFFRPASGVGLFLLLTGRGMEGTVAWDLGAQRRSFIRCSSPSLSGSRLPRVSLSAGECGDGQTDVRFGCAMSPSCTNQRLFPFSDNSVLTISIGKSDWMGHLTT